MNCLDFRREVSAEPLRLGAGAREHANMCAGCRAFLDRQRELDAELYDAMRVPVPDGLADRVLVSHGVRNRRRPLAWAIAASVLAAAGITMFAPAAFSGRALAQDALAHVAEEPQALRISNRYAADRLPAELATQGMRLASALGEVTYATLCPMASGKAMHLVVATAAGPVTLLLLPGDDTRRSRSVVEGHGMTAIALPAARGSIAIVAASREQALAVENALVLS